MNETPDTAQRPAQPVVATGPLFAISDERGNPLSIGMRVGCRNIGEPRSWSRRGLTLIGYEHGTKEPYITDEGRFALAIKDHQPDMDEWRAAHVVANNRSEPTARTAP